MAVERMSRVTVLGHLPAVDDVLAALQRAGVLEIEAQPYDVRPAELPPDDERLRRLDEWQADAHFVREFLGRHHVLDQPFSAFVSEKVHLSTDEFLALEPDARFLRLYKECASISDRLASGERERARLETLVSELEPWRASHLQISRLHATTHVALFAGTVPASRGPEIRQALRDVTSDVSVQEFGPVGSRQAWVVMAHRSELDVVRGVLMNTDFAEYDFHGLEGYPAEEIARAEHRIDTVADESDVLTERARELAADHYHQILALSEALDTARNVLEVRRDMGATERAFVISGWVRECDGDRLAEVLEPWESSVDLTLEEPADEDDPPVELRNPWFVRPFELITDLYGRPAYREIDPTPLLAPFFLLFFAICVGDVGYGAMLILGAYLIKNRIDVAAGVKRFMDLLMFGGAGAMVVGALLGSWFALPVDSLPPFLRALQVLDPLAQLTAFLILCVILGMTQNFLGVVVAGYDMWRHGERADAVYGQFSTLFLFAMIGVAVFVSGAARWALPLGLIGTMLMQGGALQTALSDGERPVWDRAVGWLWLAGMVVSIAVMAVGGVPTGLATIGGLSLLALVTRTGRASVLSLLGGAYSVYGMSSFIGDILSYTRLAALGLSGGLVGMVFNLLAGMVMGGAAGQFRAGGLGWLWGTLIFIGAALIFVVGHVFNVVINLIGAFVHPARLQFVEFFGKFYEGGGRPFSPFRPKTRSLVLHAGSAGQEGGKA